MAFDDQKQKENSELRKKRRKKEQAQAFVVLLAAILVVIMVVSIVVSGVNVLLGSKQKDKNAEIAKQETTNVTQESSNQKNDSEMTTDTSDANNDDVNSDDVNSDDVNNDDANSAETEAVETEEDGAKAELTEEEQEAQKAKMLQAYVEEVLSTLSLEEKIGQMFLATPMNITGVADAKQAGSTTSAAISDYAIGGILFDESNIDDKEQFSLMIDNIRSFSKLKMFYALCDEGGEDSPLSLSGIRENPISTQSEIATVGISEAYSVGISKSSEFRSLGINLNLAPMADVSTNASSSIASRSFGDSVSEVLSLARSEFKGMNDQNVDCCVKYFPGHGDVTGDTKTTRVTSKRTKEELEENEGIIFKGLIEDGVQMIMVSHISMPEIIGDNTPSSLSSKMVTDILRTEWGFDGVVVTDYMSKNAITRFYKHADASVMAVKAGVDMIAVPGDFDKSYNGLLKAVQDGEISEERINESVIRILKMKYRNVINYDVESETDATDEAEVSEETE